MLSKLINLVISAAIYVLLLGSSSLLAQQPSDTKSVMRPVILEEDIAVQAITPIAVDGFVGEAFLRKPPGDGPFPAVVLIHGGAPRWPTEQLRDFAVHIHASRFLAAGYVVVAITRRDLDLNLPAEQEQNSVLDAVAVVDYLAELSYIDPKSIVVRGTSVGGYLTLEVGAAREVAAIMVEEPFSMPFVGASLGPANDKPINTDKLKQIKSPILLVRGDQTPSLNDFNRDTLIPALEAAGKSLEVLTYPGELHSFAFYNSPERSLRPAIALQAFEEIEAFFRENVQVKPVPLSSNLVEHFQIIR